MVRRTTSPSSPQCLLAVVGACAVALSASWIVAGESVAESAVAAQGVPGLGVAAASERAGGSLYLTSTALEVVSSTGHRLRLQVSASRFGSDSRISVVAETRSRAEQHRWDFPVPRRAISLSDRGRGRIHLSSKRGGGHATLWLKVVPHGDSTYSKCHGKIATRTRRVTLTGTVLLHTGSHGKHAWGAVGSARRTWHFARHTKLTWTRSAADNCSGDLTTLPCRTTLLWLASGDPEDFRLMAGENKGSGSLIEGEHSVALARPKGATRTDSSTRADASQASLTDNGSSVTMQAAFGAGTATMTSDTPQQTVVQRCAGGKKISVAFWPGTYANGPTPIQVPEQIFGALTMPDGSGAGLYQITRTG